MVDYNRMAALAERLIQADGRLVTVVKLARTPVDADKPWRGDPTPRDMGRPADEFQAYGVTVDTSSLSRFGFYAVDDELVKRAKKAVIISAKAVGNRDLEYYDEVLDIDQDRWKVRWAMKLKPGEIPLLFALGVGH